MFLSVSLDTKIKRKNIMTLKEFFKKLTSKIIWVNLLAMAVFIMLVAFGVWKGLEIYTHHGEEIEVPDVKGVQLGFAERMLSSRGLKAVVVDSSYNKALVGNSILEQTPQPGKTVKQGREIYLVINTVKTPTIAIPDLADNSSLREAEARLKALGFKLAPCEYVDGERDWVYGVKCQGKNVFGGDRIPIDALITLQVGSGDFTDNPEEQSDSIDVPVSEEEAVMEETVEGLAW